MSELRDRYDGDLVAENIAQPGFDNVRTQAVRHRARRRGATIAGVAAIAALIAVPVGVLASGGIGNLPGTAPAASPTPERGNDLLPRHPRIQVVDATHWVVTYELTEGCGLAVRTTSDAGKHWGELHQPPQMRCESPAELDKSGSVRRPDIPDLVILDADSLAWVAARESFISHDGGATWKAYQPKNTEVEALPDGARPRWVCADNHFTCDNPDVGAYDPDTGDRLVLASQPSDLVGYAVTVAADGSYWTVGSRGKAAAIAVSHDMGRTWTTTTLSPTSDAAAVHSYDGSTGFAAAYRKDTAGNDVMSLLRTTDGGKHWESLPATGLPADSNYLRVAEDGTVVMWSHSGGSAYASTDNGATFHKATQPGDLDVVWFPGGCYGADNKGRTYLSQDCLTWQEISAPGYR